jgi:hypothetical protein
MTLSTLIAVTIALVLLAVVAQRFGYAMIAILLAAAAWLALALVCLFFLARSWGL